MQIGMLFGLGNYLMHNIRKCTRGSKSFILENIQRVNIFVLVGSIYYLHVSFGKLPWYVHICTTQSYKYHIFLLSPLILQRTKPIIPLLPRGTS